jgi:hypothetical protein
LVKDEFSFKRKMRAEMLVCQPIPFGSIDTARIAAQAGYATRATATQSGNAYLTRYLDEWITYRHISTADPDDDLRALK